MLPTASLLMPKSAPCPLFEALPKTDGPLFPSVGELAHILGAAFICCGVEPTPGELSNLRVALSVAGYEATQDDVAAAWRYALYQAKVTGVPDPTGF